MEEQVILYTLPNCPHCEDARRLLADEGTTYREVSIDNPMIEAGFRAVLGKIVVPCLLKPDGNLYFLVETEPGKKRFVRLLV